MNARTRDMGSTSTLTRRLTVLVFSIAALLPALAFSEESTQQLATLVQEPVKLMPEEHRATMKKVVVLPGRAPAGGAVTGSYGKETLGLLDGVDKGLETVTITKEIGGIPIGYPIRILQVPAALIGGLIGATTRQVQDFRDALAADLVEGARTTLTNDALATDVFWSLREVPGLKPKVLALTTPIPEDTDAILYVSFSKSVIDIQQDEAVLTMSARATLRRMSDGEHIYEHEMHYSDKDTLKNWIRNDNAAWKDFAAYARHYLGREISAEIYERVKIKSDLRPRKTATVALVKKNAWQGVSKTTSPTLAWEHSLDDADSQQGWAKAISDADIAYDVEIYDKHQIVYGAKELTASQFTLDVELEACKTYWWSVRPSYRVGNEVRFGEWMRSNPDAANGNNGNAAAEATAYIYDFASLEIKCGRR